MNKIKPSLHQCKFCGKVFREFDEGTDSFICKKCNIEDQIYAKIELEGFGGYTQPLDALQHVIDDIRCAAENDELNATWIITFVEMTEREYQELPEFEGF